MVHSIRVYDEMTDMMLDDIYYLQEHFVFLRMTTVQKKKAYSFVMSCSPFSFLKRQLDCLHYNTTPYLHIIMI